jgi:hypothetical protein
MSAPCSSSHLIVSTYPPIFIINGKIWKGEGRGVNNGSQLIHNKEPLRKQKWVNKEMLDNINSQQVKPQKD